MAVYTFTSGIESESVGQYTNYLLAALQPELLDLLQKELPEDFLNLLAVKKKNVRLLSAVVDLYTEIDFGNILYTPQPVTATDAVQVDDLNATLSNTILSDSGTGTGTTGGFNIGNILDSTAQIT